MSEASSSNSKPMANLTAREQETILGALQNLKSGEIQIDYNGMAETLGLKDNRSAAAAWSAVKKKLFANTKGATDGEASPSNPKTPRKRKDPAATTPKSGKKNTKSPDTVKDDGNGGGTDLEAEGEMNAAKQGIPATPGTPDVEEMPTTPQSPVTPGATPSTGKKRGRKSKAETETGAAVEGEAQADGEKEAKSVKKPRKTPVKKKAAEDEAGDDTSAATPKKPAVRRNSAAKASTSTTKHDIEEKESATGATDANGADKQLTSATIGPDAGFDSGVTAETETQVTTSVVQNDVATSTTDDV
ncbi:uncharacterized protein Z518_10579 [Rhinocladiella mackenziei CBS 650.93]|uniref:Uncharacterized protein n=1 Tax=Rhinocladiella mackenziei CBS 650.93 TaxID=1442369 RepID=A0A0D2IUP6_9EURO|nr:uncharacterized protein Z518_10579 [Rhinocladiella mackenziei CBS 650.93]KIX00440.1 hypothetical protein Z518_10579 [Rhinocladiella mackenziei CBS 650.93]